MRAVCLKISACDAILQTRPPPSESRSKYTVIIIIVNREIFSPFVIVTKNFLNFNICKFASLYK